MGSIVINGENVETCPKPKRSLLNLCCCRSSRNSTIILNPDPQSGQDYHYVVKKLIIKRVPVKNLISCDETNVNTENNSLKPIVFSSYCQSSPEKYVLGKKDSGIIMNTDLVKRKKNIVPIHFTCDAGGDNDYEEWCRDTDLISPNIQSNSSLKDSFTENGKSHNDEGKYLLKKIASDLSNNKDVKWKIIIKQNKNKSAEPSNNLKRDSLE
ncbi:uncharacterized protein [Atheta coriaria]